MATLVLGAIGASLGGAFGATAAIVGQAVGGVAGAILDRQIVNALTPPIHRSGPRLTTTEIQSSSEGAPIDRVCGRARIGGQIIWATRFEEEYVEEKSGGKGDGPSIVTQTWTYYGNFAVGLCEGDIAGIGRIWADGKEIDQDEVEFRVHRGGENQAPDPLIEAKEDNAPAYRGLAYIVFERLDLTTYGNRLPQISAEVFRRVGDLESMIEGVAVIAGNEFGFGTTVVRHDDEENGGRQENRNTLVAGSDWEASIDRLQMLCPNLKTVMLVVPWFGDDLRCGHCTIRPKVDSKTKATTPLEWAAAGLTRDQAQEVSYIDGRAAYGGAPSDETVLAAIANLKDRGLRVTLLPFIMMDVSQDNELPNPYSDNAGDDGQPAYPWRGRITVSPAVSFAGSPDKTSAAGNQVDAFVGQAAPSDFGSAESTVTYSGPDEWSYRHFILHCAKLADIAGGVDAFVVGSEMIGLTQVRSDQNSYPFVVAIRGLLDDVRAMLGPSVKLTYAADWSEYHSHRPADGTGDVYFNMDPIWSHPELDVIGIDNYLPLSDWRDGRSHLDFSADGPTTIYDPAYLAANVEGGEWYDWYYASQADRDDQARTPIVDMTETKHWVFRQKDIRNWWLNEHFHRPGGEQNNNSTNWQKQSKPIWFTELGCPAVDKGANQPNVFPDPKSSEGIFPHYSNRARDDAIQRAWLEAMIGHFQIVAGNPVSEVYDGPMVDLSWSNVWCWDARPWPSFPLDRQLWGDAENWYTGHWISGRLGTAPARETIREICREAGFSDRFVEPIPVVADGVTTGTVCSDRARIEALRPVMQFDAVERASVVRFVARAGLAPRLVVQGDSLVVDPERGERFRETRLQETDLPDAVKLRYGDPLRDDQPAATEARRSTGGSQRTIEMTTPVVIAENFAQAAVERELASAWAGRERTSFTLPPSALALEPGDVIEFAPTGRQLRLGEITDGEARQVDAFRVDPMAQANLPHSLSEPPVKAIERILDADVVLIDGPLLDDEDDDWRGYVAGRMQPLGHGIALWRSPGSDGFVLDRVLGAQAIIGETTANFHSGPVWRWDRVNSLYLKLFRGELSSASELSVLGGANALLVENQDGGWELLQFATATPNGTRNYVLTDLLRGQRGSEQAMRDPVPAGARVVLVNAAVVQTGLPTALVGVPQNWRAGPASRPVAHPSYQAFTVAIDARARAPLSPVHLAGRRDHDSGDWTISWVRRTRIGGDPWQVAEVPLGEASESYQMEILAGAGGNVVRSFTTAGPSQVYTAAQQSTDFGDIQWSFWVRVAQLSQSYGPGSATQALIWVR